MTLIMIVAGFLFVSVSGYLAGLVGSSNNPVSGITIATILFASVVLIVLLGRDSSIGAVGSEEHTSELQSLMRTSYAVFCLKKKKPPYEQSLTITKDTHQAHISVASYQDK